MRPFRAPPRALLTFLKLLVTLTAILLIARKVDFGEMGGTLSGAAWGWLAAAVLLQFVAALLQALRWKTLIPAPMALRKYLYYVFVGYLLTSFLPSAALAEGARTYAFGRRYGAVQKNFVAMLLGRAIGMAVALLAAALVFVSTGTRFADLPAWEHIGPRGSWVWAAVLLATLALGGAAAFVLRNRAVSIWRDIRILATDRGMIFRVVWISILMQAVVIVSTQWVFRSVGWHLPAWQAVFIPVVLQLLLLAPMSAGGVGVREYLGLALYGGLGGVPAHIVLAAGILSYIPVLLLASTGAGWMLYRQRIRAEEKP